MPLCPHLPCCETRHRVKATCPRFGTTPGTGLTTNQAFWQNARNRHPSGPQDVAKAPQRISCNTKTSPTSSPRTLNSKTHTAASGRVSRTTPSTGKSSRFRTTSGLRRTETPKVHLPTTLRCDICLHNRWVEVFGFRQLLFKRKGIKKDAQIADLSESVGPTLPQFRRTSNETLMAREKATQGDLNLDVITS